jgi:hypothetical protein
MALSVSPFKPKAGMRVFIIASIASNAFTLTASISGLRHHARYAGVFRAAVLNSQRPAHLSRSGRPCRRRCAARSLSFMTMSRGADAFAMALGGVLGGLFRFAPSSPLLRRGFLIMTRRISQSLQGVSDAGSYAGNPKPRNSVYGAGYRITIRLHKSRGRRVSQAASPPLFRPSPGKDCLIRINSCIIPACTRNGRI